MSELLGHVIAFGNEKGGSGKSTTAVHTVVSLIKMGKRVGVIDLDSRQRSLARYFENRANWAAESGAPLPMPEVAVISHSDLDSRREAQHQEKEWFEETLGAMRGRCDFVVIDTPGSDTPLARIGHAACDTLVTPLNDSFVDFDLLAKVDPKTFQVVGPSIYSEAVWDSRKRRAISRRPPIDWVVMRNRVSAVDARNKRRVGDVIELLSKRVGFRLSQGLGERVIYRELFPFGLTVVDLGEPGVKRSLTLSHVAARQEVRELVLSLRLPGIEQSPQPAEGDWNPPVLSQHNGGVEDDAGEDPSDDRFQSQASYAGQRG
jgi:chromosome partitioning protein